MLLTMMAAWLRSRRSLTSRPPRSRRRCRRSMPRHKGELHDGSFAKKPSAFLRMSRSIFTFASSCRRLFISCCSADFVVARCSVARKFQAVAPPLPRCHRPPPAASSHHQRCPENWGNSIQYHYSRDCIARFERIARGASLVRSWLQIDRPVDGNSSRFPIRTNTLACLPLRPPLTRIRGPLLSRTR